MAIRRAVEIVPVDIRRIRQGLGFSQKRMGERLAEYLEGHESPPIPGTRINEWEKRVRAIPDYVFIAYATIWVDTWAETRESKGAREATKIDPKFADILSPALASAIAFESEFRGRRDKEGARIFMKAQQIRRDVQCYLESLLMINMEKINFRGTSG